ncbi:MAG: succinate dehydrogenase cytochrome b subunit [Elusimicrobia bacterium]|nr:succinate dehydrogenase cytochrome b subunit [Elusimicrobiota bacterium]
MQKACFFSSTIGKKVVVALTGIILVGFVIGHMAGNLQVFEGPQKINDYSAYLKHATILLWGTRIVLLVSVTLHILCTVQLKALDVKSRPVGYVMYEPVQASRPSRFMIWSGAFLGLYIVYHIMHLTLGVHPNFSKTDIYSNIVYGFSQWPVAVVYILAMISLGFHLHHGVYSVFQTLGLNHPKYNPWRRCLALGVAWVVAVGFASIPVAVLAGVLRIGG